MEKAISKKAMRGWYLREDFNPEPIQSLINNGFKSSFVEKMKEAGNLFDTREEAERASKKIKAFFCSNPENNEDLRIWCIEHPSNQKRFFDLYDWLVEEKGRERELRKLCVLHENMCAFKTLEETLEWIKTGITPDWVPAMYEEFDKIASQVKEFDK